VNSNGKLVFELDAVSESVVDIEDGDGVIALVGIAVSDPSEVDLPMLVAGGFRSSERNGGPACASR
jgi:hypothetical protein